jgi:hypothetical protein
MFKSSISKILISVLCLKVMFIMDFDFLILNFLTLLIDLSPSSRGKPADSSRHTRLKIAEICYTI